MHSDPNMSAISIPDDDFLHRHSSVSPASPGFYDHSRMSGEGSPMMMSPWNQSSPFNKSQWSTASTNYEDNVPQNSLIGSLVREEGHIYSLAASGELLYTGSDSKNIRVWKNLKEFSAFKGRRRRSALWIKHSDAVSCLSLNKEQGLLYSASWDRTIKVWRISDSKCLESISAHDDAVNAVVASVDDLVFSGSADGTVKVWKREMLGKTTKHALAESLLKQECAVTSLAMNRACSVAYGGSSDGLVNFWERGKQFTHGGVLKGHKLAILCLASAGNLLFSGSADKTICVWRRDGTIHTCLSVLTGHTGPVKCLATEEDAESARKGEQRWIVYSGSLDKSVKQQQQQQVTYDADSVPSDGSFSSAGRNSQNRRY
ncbi:hypothetical protein EUGRSUZ_F01502 [Eucalyptus grandis]|uniref:Uncharacterized protein n=2 Tax=Eucalyptus grandis TaxID=71139 RepID=A0ACC3KEC0_EUCGR|nr:hypothetical protein EUGRSUZ_F01502 [Eucalyptus grandis]